MNTLSSLLRLPPIILNRIGVNMAYYAYEEEFEVENTTVDYDDSKFDNSAIEVEEDEHEEPQNATGNPNLHNLAPKMRIISISDTHNGHKSLTKELLNLRKKDENYSNILIHSGDMTEGSSVNELLDVQQWFDQLSKHFDYILCIGGNMDGIILDKKYFNGHKIFDSKDKNIYYLENESIVINNCKFYGLPHTPRFYGGFQLSSNKEYKEIYDKIELDTDILISHGPIYNVLDETSSGKHAGCRILSDYVLNKIQPSLMIFGHIHPSFGVKQVQIKKNLTENDSIIDSSINNSASSCVTFVNCAQHDGLYGGTNINKDVTHIQPIVFDFDPNTTQYVFE